MIIDMSDTAEKTTNSHEMVGYDPSDSEISESA